MRRALEPGVALTLLLSVATAFATDYTWTGGTSGAWTDRSNWTPNTGYPNAADDTAAFAPSAGTKVSLSSPVDVKGISVSGAGGLTLTGKAIALGSDGIASTSSVACGISNDVTIAAAQTPFALTGSGPLHMGGVISGAGGILKTGHAYLHLYRDNPFAGEYEAKGDRTTPSGAAVTSSAWETGSGDTYIYAGGALGANHAYFDRGLSIDNALCARLVVVGGMTIATPIHVTADYGNTYSLLFFGKGNVDFTGDLASKGRFRARIGQTAKEVRFRGAVTHSNYMVLYADATGSDYFFYQPISGSCQFTGPAGATRVHLCSGGNTSCNWFHDRATVICEAPNVIPPKLSYFELNSATSCIDLNGFDQTVTSLDATRFKQYSGTGHGFTSATPARIRFVGTSIPSFGARWTLFGAAGLEWDPQRADGTFVQSNTVSSTTGELVVGSGRFVLADGASFTALSALRLGSGAVFAVERGSGAGLWGGNLVAADGARFELAEGVDLRVESFGGLPYGTVLDASNSGGLVTGAGRITVAGASSRPVSVWRGADGGDWTDPANWSSDAVPDSDCRVFISNGTVTVNARIDPVGSITVCKGATVTCAGPFTDERDQSTIHLVCGDLTVEKGGKIDATQKGWSGGRWTGTPPADPTQLKDKAKWSWKDTHANGYGPGAASGWVGFSGADHGGLGGSWRILDRKRTTYGDPRHPTTAGSGADLPISYGGEVYRDISSGTNGFCRGFSGGGVIRIEATGNVRVDGEIRADGKGQNSTGGNRDCASAGGSVWITCRTISGSGTVSAAGGNQGDPRFPHFLYRDASKTDGRFGHPGGGGRIAIDYDPAAEETADADGLFITAAAGEYASSLVSLATRDNFESMAEPGTLSFSDTNLVKRLFGRGLSGRIVGLKSLAFGGDLDFRRGFVASMEAGFSLTVGGNLTITNRAARLEVGGVCLTNRAARATVYAGSEVNRLRVGGDFTVADGGSFVIRSAQVDGATGEEKWGGRVDVAGKMTVGAGGYVYAAADGINLSAPRFDVGALTVAEGGTLSADRRGGLGKDFHSDFYCRMLLGKALAAVETLEYHGYGPVWGTQQGGGGYKCNAAGHGGRGGRSFSTNPQTTYGIDGEPYDDRWHPVLPGSGGSSLANDAGSEGGTGGGVIHVTSEGPVAVNGTVSADGWCGSAIVNSGNTLKSLNSHGPGSGGTVFLSGARVIFGAHARVSARGGDAVQGPNGASWQGTGGGGRIAIRTAPRTASSDETVETRLEERPADVPDVFDAAPGDPLLLTGVTSTEPTEAQLKILCGQTGTVSFVRVTNAPKGLVVVFGRGDGLIGDMPEGAPVIRRGHPRLFFNAETWPAVKAAAEGPARSSFEALIRRCDGYPDDPVCTGMDPIPPGQDPAVPIPDVKEWGAQAAECALAWRFTGEEKYLRRAKRMLEVSIAAYHEAYRNYRAVSWYSTSRILALCAYDWIFYALTEEERKAILVPLMQHIEDVQNGKGPDGKTGIVRHNGGPTGYLAGHYGTDSILWYSGAAASGDGICDELAAKHLRTGYAYMRQLFAYRAAGSGDDGPLSTVTSTYALGQYPWAHFNYFHTLLSAAGVRAAPHYPGLGLFPNYIWWDWIRSDLFPMEFGAGDTHHAKNELTVNQLNEHLAQYAHFYAESDPTAARLAATLRQYVPQTRLDATWPMYPYLLAGDGVRPFPEEKVTDFPVRARHFETAGQIVLRSGWRADSTYCMFTAGGSFTEHRHYDENNFVIYKNGFLALDTGSRANQTDYNLEHYYAQTVAHNCVLIHKPEEPLPRHWGVNYDGVEGKWCDGGQTKHAAARLLAFETNPLYTYIASDAAAAYPGKCAEAVRQFLHLTDDCFVVYDRVEATDAAYGKEWLLHTEEEPALEGNLMTATTAPGGTIHCRTILPTDATLSTVGGPDREFWSNGRNWPLDPSYVSSQTRACQTAGSGPWFGRWRLSVSPAAAAKADRFLHVIDVSGTSARAAFASVADGDADRDGVTVDIPGVTLEGRTGTLKATVRFNRAGAVGGVLAYRLVDGDGAELLSGARTFSDRIQPQSGVAAAD